MRDEILVLGEEEERVHLAVHRLVGDVEALLVRPPETPMADASPGLQGHAQMLRSIAVRAHDVAHRGLQPS